jgi:hypothetical protein
MFAPPVGIGRKSECLMTTSLEGWINENENRALVYEYIPEIEKKIS